MFELLLSDYNRLLELAENDDGRGWLWSADCPTTCCIKSRIPSIALSVRDFKEIFPEQSSFARMLKLNT
jgi:hypothetical protein